MPIKYFIYVSTSISDHDEDGFNKFTCNLFAKVGTVQVCTSAVPFTDLPIECFRMTVTEFMATEKGAEMKTQVDLRLNEALTKMRKELAEVAI